MTPEPTEHERAAAIADDDHVEGRANRLAVYEVLRTINRAPAVGQTYLRGARRTAHRRRVAGLATHRPQADTGVPARAQRRARLSTTGVLVVAHANGKPLATRLATAPAGRMQKANLPARQPKRTRKAGR